MGLSGGRVEANKNMRSDSNAAEMRKENILSFLNIIRAYAFDFVTRPIVYACIEYYA